MAARSRSAIRSALRARGTGARRGRSSGRDPWDHTRSSASAPMAAKGPWPCLSGVDCPGSTTGDAALSSALVERDVETLVAALIAAFFIVAGIGGRVRPFQFRLRDRERPTQVVVGTRIDEVEVGATQ